MNKQKLFNKEDYILFIDSISIKASKIIKNKSLDLQKRAYNRVTTILYIFVSSCSSFLSHVNSHDAPEGRKLIESIYSKNNNYLLMDRVYEDDKTFDLAEAPSFYIVVSPKKIVSYLGVTIDTFINIAILSNDIF